jgi:DNA-binding PadR family transcriptional regulator
MIILHSEAAVLLVIQAAKETYGTEISRLLAQYTLNEMEMPKATVWEAMRKLEKAGWIKRLKKCTDGNAWKSTYFELTEPGQELARDIRLALRNLMLEVDR